MRGCIAQIEFLFGLHSQAAPTDKPLPNVWQAITNRGDPQYCEFCDQGALAAFMDQMTMPGGLRQIHSQDPQLFGQGRTASDRRCRRGWPRAEGPGSSIGGVRSQTGVSEGTSAIYHLCNAAMASENAGFFA